VGLGDFIILNTIGRHTFQSAMLTLFRMYLNKGGGYGPKMNAILSIRFKYQRQPVKTQEVISAKAQSPTYVLEVNINWKGVGALL
jgi:hypothetical protein